MKNQTTERIILSGFGGQGVLTLGQLIASLGLYKGLNVTWIPSYGAEMRGGTANCSVIVSENIIGSPMVTRNADILVALNNPSIDKFLPAVRPGGTVVINSSIVTADIPRDDVSVVKVDAINLSVEMGNPKVQNMLMLGGYLRVSGRFTLEEAGEVMRQKFGEKYPHMVDINLRAIEKGMNA